MVSEVTWGLYVNVWDAAGNASQASGTVPITAPQCQADTQPPTAPTKLTGSASEATVTLTWTAATGNIGVRAYDVYRDGAKAGTITGTATTAAPTTGFIDSAFSANTTYYYYVVTRDARAGRPIAFGMSTPS